MFYVYDSLIIIINLLQLEISVSNTPMVGGNNSQVMLKVMRLIYGKAATQLVLSFACYFETIINSKP